jgi:aspartate kinase
MIVMKFGGTSVGDARAMQRVIDIVKKEQHRSPVVVLSAISGATNALLKAAHFAQRGELEEAVQVLNQLLEWHVTIAENLIDHRPTVQQLIFSFKRRIEELRNLCSGIAILGELTNRSLDVIASTGEQLSSSIISEAFRAQGVPVELVDARTFMITDEQYTSAVPQFDQINDRVQKKIDPILKSGTIVVTQGFVGATATGKTTTLGRGGSDYSAAIIGAALDAEEIQIWTDVDGILTTDPRIVPNAQKLSVVSFREAAELAYFGAKVLHPSTISPAVQKNIPVIVLNSMRPESTGTHIISDPPKADIPVKSIAFKRGITIVKVQSMRMLMAYGFLESIFSVFNKYETAVDLVSTSEVAVSLTIDNNLRLPEIVEALSQFAEVSTLANKAIICTVGDQMQGTAGVANRIFRALADINILMITQGASDINMSFVVEDADVTAAVQRLHKELFDSTKTNNFLEPIGGVSK